MRQLATIQRIANLTPILGADKIEVATILGWEVVVKKGEFKVGDLAVYIEIDSIVPDRPEFEFLRERKFRIKTIKLRKQISQGLALPLSIIPQKLVYKGNAELYLKEGNDVTETLGVIKYDPQAEQEAKLVEQDVTKTGFAKVLMKYRWYRRLILRPVKAPFPKFIAKTDETRIQNMPRILQTLSHEEFVVTEKLDGQSATYFVIKKKQWWGGYKFVFGVCSRNWQLLKEDNSSYWTVARQFNLKRILTQYLKDVDAEFVVLQGEIIGERIQGNKYKIEGYDFYAFNFKFSNCVYNTAEMFSSLTCGQNIKVVPILNRQYKLPETVQAIVEYSKGNSVVGAKPIREGVVIRCSRQNVSFKVINPDFLLKNEE